MSTIIDRPNLSTDWLNRREYPFAAHWLDVEGGKMHYIDEGAGEPILFVHGVPTWSFLFRNLIKDLSEKHRCIAMDHIGFGLSDKPKEWSYSPMAQARNVAHLVDRLNLKNFTLVVHDVGGPIGLDFAEACPGQIKRVIMFNTWMCDWRGDPALERVSKLMLSPVGRFMYLSTNVSLKLMKAHFGDKSRFTETLEQAYSGPFHNKEDRVGLWKTIRHFVDCGPWFGELWHQRKSLSGLPMLLLWGMKDATFGERYLNKLWHEYPLADVETFPASGTFSMEEHPVEVTYRVREFLASPLRQSGYIS